MLIDILPDLIRGGTTTVCLLVLLPILAKTTIESKKYYIFGFTATIIDLLISYQFYRETNYNGLVYYSLVFYVFIIMLLKHMLREKWLQWLFNCITVLNAYAIIVIASYLLSQPFIHPEYAVTAIRLILFVITILLFKFLFRPLYLEVSKNWGSFLLPIFGILLNYLYILLSIRDVESSMDNNTYYFYLLTVVTIFTYLAIISSLKSLRDKFLLREENIKRKASEDLLKSEITYYENTLFSAKQTRHDIRHHNSILLEYLSSNDIDGAKEYLKMYDDNIKLSLSKDFSKDPVLNAVFRIYDRRFKENKISFMTKTSADYLLKDRLPEVGIVLSNVLENALTSCLKQDEDKRFVSYASTLQNDSILIEIKNSVDKDIKFVDGMPISTKIDGGTGLLSIKSIVESAKGMLNVKVEAQVFHTLIILPLKTN